MWDRLRRLERWLELGERPGAAVLEADGDGDLLRTGVDDIPALRQRCARVRAQCWDLRPRAARDEHLAVGPSWIAGAGDGLFSRVSLAAGDLVCRYGGQLHSARSAAALRERSYLMRIDQESNLRSCYVDPGPCLDVKARYINDCRTREGHNVAFRPVPEEGCAHIVALRDIAEGEELFMSYGAWYWDAHGGGTLLRPRCLAARLEALGAAVPTELARAAEGAAERGSGADGRDGRGGRDGGGSGSGGSGSDGDGGSGSSRDSDGSESDIDGVVEALECFKAFHRDQRPER